MIGVFTRADVSPFHPYPDERTKKDAPAESGVALQDDEFRWIDQHLGRVEYHTPVNAEAPEFETDLVNEPDPRMPGLGARGIGEIGILGSAAAIAAAVFHATERRVRDLPITPDKLI